MTITPTISQLKMLAALRGNLWAIAEAPAVELALGALEFTDRHAKEYSDEYLAEFYTLRQKAFIDADGIAHIEIRGALLQDVAPIYERIGKAVRYKTITAETMAAVEQGAKGILYHINSPGGTVSGNVEVSELIASLPIPTATFGENLVCSAAYKIAAGTGMIVASKSALMGNIGTILSWADCSEFWAKWGVNFKAIVSEGADLKSTFHLEPDEAQLAFLQESVNEAGKQFRDHVTAGRAAAGAELDPEVWRAGWYAGERAGELGLIDDIGTAESTRQLLLSPV